MTSSPPSAPLIAQPAHPAAVVAHWSTGPVPACEKHALALVGLGRFMGLHVALTHLDEPAECTNCVNEAKTPKTGEQS